MPAAESAVLMAGGVGHPLKSFVGGFYGNENPLPKQKALNGWDLSHGKHNGINGSFGNKSVSGYAPQPPDIIDIRGVAVESDLKEEILSSFLSTPGQRAMPTILLYDQRGLQIFEEVGVFSPPLSCYAINAVARLVDVRASKQVRHRAYIDDAHLHRTDSEWERANKCCQITYLEEYYLTNDEISVLESSASEIARAIPDGSMVVELGSGYD